MTSGGQEHWDRVYAAREEEALTWFEANPSLSRDLIQRFALPGDPIIDVGGGASRLVDALLDAGLGPLAVLDISPAALDSSRRRLGHRAEAVTWIAADITRWRADRSWAVWHDRAVFHFLTAPPDRAAYAEALSGALLPGGTAIIATFAEDGPDTCSSLPVVRYAPDDLWHQIETTSPGRFARIEARRHVHLTPKGNRQNFQVSVFRRTGSA